MTMVRRLHLKYKGITPKTSRAYRKEVNRFFQYLASEGLAVPDCLTQLDALLAEYVNVSYQNGDSLTLAGWLLSGFRRFVPEARFRIQGNSTIKIGSVTMSRFVQFHCRGRLPKPCQRWLGRRVTRILLLLAFCFFLRSMEFIMLRREHVVVDLLHGQVILTLERTKTSKQFQQSLVLQHRKLAIILDRALRSVPAHGPIWRFSAAQFRSCFSALLDNIRRGGATHACTNSRDLNAVAIHGRWRDLRTACIYLDDARATLVQLSFAPPISHHIASCSGFFRVAPPIAIRGHDWDWAFGCLSFLHGGAPSTVVEHPTCG